MRDVALEFISEAHPSMIGRANVGRNAFEECVVKERSNDCTFNKLHFKN